MHSQPPPAADFDEPSPPVRVPLTSALCCLRCGYSLRGLRRDGDCPECGLGVWESCVLPARPAVPMWFRAVRLAYLTAACGIWLLPWVLAYGSRGTPRAARFIYEQAMSRAMLVWMAAILMLWTTVLYYRPARRDWMIWVSVVLLAAWLSREWISQPLLGAM